MAVLRQSLVLPYGSTLSPGCSSFYQASSVKTQPGKLRITCYSRAAEAIPRADAPPSLYNLLGLDQSVELPQIKAAYRRMALKYHPDVSPPEDRELNTKIFLQVQDAYDILSDPISREGYDHLLQQKLPGQFRGWEQAGHYRSRRHRTEGDFSSESWKSQWEAQLERFISRTPDRTTWGARRRCQQSYS